MPIDNPSEWVYNGIKDANERLAKKEIKMNAQEMLLEYAAKHNDRKVYTDEQFIGKAITEGIRLSDNERGGIVICNIKREGKTIIVTETTKTEAIVDRKPAKVCSTVEILRVNV